jgi:hypothetical protein
MFVYESLSDFLNEDLGSLKPFSDIPSEWKNEILRTQQGGRGGMKSKVEELSIDSDYKTFLKKFKDSDFLVAIVKINGKSKYLIASFSTNKFKIKDADQEYSVRKKKREEEDKRREEEIKRREEERVASQKNENLNPPKYYELNEARGRHQHYDPADLGEKSVPELQGWLKDLKTKNSEDNIQLFIIYADLERRKKISDRSSAKSLEDPLNPQSSHYDPSSSRSQKERYDIFAEKKRAELDKKFDRVLDNFKQQIIDNFDKSMEKTISDIRKGYSWSFDLKTIGENLLKGIDMKELRKFVEAYDAIEPNPAKKDAAEASNKLKKLGF